MSFRNDFVVGLTAAIAATVIAPVLVPVVKRAGRPLAKSLVKGGLMLYESSREAVARAGESMEDMIAEVRAEETTGQHPGFESADGDATFGKGIQSYSEGGESHDDIRSRAYEASDAQGRAA